MTKQTLITSLYQIGAIQFGEFTLKSGQTSSIYINLRKIISYPDILRLIATTIWEAIHDCQFDVVCGVPYTALPIATCVSLDHHIPMIIRRKEKKEYGTKQLIEGVFEKGQRCLIIEDIITTGGSIVETATDLTQAGLEITDVVALIDREQGGKENLSRHYKTHTILTLSEILHTLMASSLLNTEEQTLINRFLTEKMIK
jgi:orotate phosphoribosyltransferase